MLKVIAEKQPGNRSRVNLLDHRASLGRWNEADLAVNWKAEIDYKLH